MRFCTPPALTGIGIACFIAGCASRGSRLNASQSITFITRDGCVNTEAMRANLDTALATLRLPTNYQILDADTLPTADPRGGYGTPTVLYKGKDVFGMPAPAAAGLAAT